MYLEELSLYTDRAFVLKIVHYVSHGFIRNLNHIIESQVMVVRSKNKEKIGNGCFDSSDTRLKKQSQSLYTYHFCVSYTFVNHILPIFFPPFFY